MSTIPGTSALSPSEGSEGEGSPGSGIDKRHWKAKQARLKFQSSRVKAENVDFSDRLNIESRSYRTFSRRRQPGNYDDAEQYGDFSDEDEETLDRKLARLRQEVEDIKATIEEEKASNDSDSEERNGASEVALENVNKISEALDSVYISRRGGTKGAEMDLTHMINSFRQADKKESQDSIGPTNSSQQSAADGQTFQILARAGEFEARLTLIEEALGITAANMPETGENAILPILPTLQSLEQVIGAALAQPSQLEAAQVKTRQLLKDAERLSRAQSENQGNQSELSQTTIGKGDTTTFSADQEAKVNALYGLLPTIDTLSPTVPLLLDRLRTLRLLHTSAATSSATLDDIEQRQQEQDEEIRQWDDALDQVETNLKEGQNTLAENMQQMGSMVKKLESKLSSLS